MACKKARGFTAENFGLDVKGLRKHTLPENLTVNAKDLYQYLNLQETLNSKHSNLEKWEFEVILILH